MMANAPHLLFAYGGLRERYDTQDASHAPVRLEGFVHPDNVAPWWEAIRHDQAILSRAPNTQWQGELSPLSRQALWELHSGIMLRLLEHLAGMSHLLPDTHGHASTPLDGSRPPPAWEAHPAWHIPRALMLWLQPDGTALLASSVQAATLAAGQAPEAWQLTYYRYAGAAT